MSDIKKFYLPDLGEGLPDAEIVEWLVKVGDVIRLDEPLVSMETAKAVVVAGVLAFRALRHRRIDLEFRQHRTGDDHIAGAAGELEHLAGKRRRHFDHGFRGFHRHQRFVEADDVADLDQPFDDFRVRQAFAEVGEQELFRGHAWVLCP